MRPKVVLACYVFVVLAALVTFAQSPPPVSFLAARSYAAGLNPESVAVGDFNGDGKPDLVVANENGDNVSVLLGNGAIITTVVMF